MTGFFSLFSKPPSLKQLSLKPYLVNLSLDRLVIGVDGIHVDAHVSPQVRNVVKNMVSDLLIKHSHSRIFLEEGKQQRREETKIDLYRVCTDVLLEGIIKAKSEAEVQIDFLGQVALAKLSLDEIHSGYRKLLARFEDLIRTFEFCRDFDQNEWQRMREKLSEIKRDQRRIVRRSGEELFQAFADIHATHLKGVRASNFPAESILPDHFFVNPTLHIDDVTDDYLLIEAYVLFGRRSDEPGNFNGIKSIIDDLLGKTDLGREEIGDKELENQEEGGADNASPDGNALDPWLMGIDNIDSMFNCFHTREIYEEAKRANRSKPVLPELKSRMNIQEKLLDLFYRRFKKAGLLNLITTAYEMKPVYRGYCPPLRPAQVREYLVKRKSRKSIAGELRRRKPKIDFSPLQEAIRRIKGCSTRARKEHLLNFLKDFLRYYRDRENSRLLKNAMEAINLVTDEKILLLSKNNRLLYEYPLSGERVEEEKPIISHVILKADIRGSMDITHTLRLRGLNPASYFSLNFFDPISEIICDYNASKVFIEGDAIILSIFENEDTAQDWYSVARACGLAVNITRIVQRYNEKNRQHDLPVLETGIGICYKPSPPAFLFDGDSRIMISQAINLADRLSGCDKKLRSRFQNGDRIFNLSVFQNVRDEEIEATVDDLSPRYNVNGIELEQEGFAKLSREISLKRIMYPMGDNEKATLYTGKVPTSRGHYQRLVIREAAILRVTPDSMDVIGPTSRKYYEVCTHPAIYEFVESRS